MPTCVGNECPDQVQAELEQYNEAEASYYSSFIFPENAPAFTG